MPGTIKREPLKPPGPAVSGMPSSCARTRAGPRRAASRRPDDSEAERRCAETSAAFGATAWRAASEEDIATDAISRVKYLGRVAARVHGRTRVCARSRSLSFALPNPSPKPDGEDNFRSAHFFDTGEESQPRVENRRATEISDWSSSESARSVKILRLGSVRFDAGISRDPRPGVRRADGWRKRVWYKSEDARLGAGQDASAPTLRSSRPATLASRRIAHRRTRTCLVERPG